MIIGAKDNSQREKPITEYVLAEYNALREEVLKRIELRHQLISLAIIAPGTIFAFGGQGQNAPFLLLYPFLAFFLAAFWASNDRQIRQLSDYIVTRIEAKVGEDNLGWEHFKNSIDKGRFGTLHFLGARGIFIGTELLSILLGISKAQFDITTYILLTLGIVSIFSTMLILIRYKVKKVAHSTVINPGNDPS